MSVRSFIVLVAAGIAPVAEAQSTLEGLLEDAHDHASALVAAEHREEGAGAGEDEARSRLLPGFTVTGSYARNQYASVATVPDGSGGTVQGVFVARDQWDALLGLEVPLLDLGALFRLRAQRARVYAATADVSAVLLDVDQAVTLAYFEWLAARAELEAATEAEATASESARIARVRATAGLVAELDVLRAEAEVARRGAAVASAREREGRAARAIEVLVGHAPIPGSDLPTDDLAPPPPLDEALARAGLLPSVEAAEHRAEAAARDAASARVAALPTLRFVASERFTNAYGFGNQPSYQLALRASLSLDLGVRARARVAGATAAAAEAEADGARAEAERVLRDAHAALESALARLVSARAERDVVDRLLRIARAEREAGQRTALELEIAERDAFDARRAVIEAEADVAGARAVLGLLLAELT